MAEETLFESERPRSRADIAAVFRSLAAEFESDGPVTVADGDRSVTVEPPDQSILELEVERESDEMSIELEIEWPESADAADVAVNEPADVAVDEPATAADADTASGSLARFEVFRDRADEWRWRLVHRNGNVIADGGEGYASKQNALKGLRSVRRNAPGAEIVSK